ncbi:MAG TPA: VWA domain-containing protein [Pyrinomonadaceae bacterium]|jgi:VWFA-related protein|nr:VWA domain-containing protein [Pyrinomonadaceae bacterium]
MNLPKALAARALAASLVCLFALASVARGQEQPKNRQQTPDEDVVRVSTSLVQVDAVVVDKDGRVVTDLRPEDFRLVEDGKPRTITEFSFVSTASAANVSPEPKSSESNPRAGEAAAPAPPARLAPGRARRTIALLVDDVGLSFETTAYVRKALTKFVDEQMQPGDLVAVIRTSGGAGSLQQFTSDRAQLRAAIERLRWYPVGRGGVAAVETMYPEDQDDVGLLLRGNRTSNKIDASGFEHFGGSVGALGYVVRGLGRFPGRKSVVLISDSFPTAGALKGITDEANRTSVVIYTMDPRGFTKFGLTADDSQYNLAANQIESRTRERHLRFKASQGGLASVAEETGGIFIYDTNDLNDGLDRVLEDQRGYYLIGYRPEADSVDADAKQRRFHKLTLEVTRPGLRVRSRSGFYEAGSSETSKRTPPTRDEQLREALTTPFDSGDLRVQLTALFADDRKLGTYVHTLIHISARDLKFKEEAGGWQSASFDLIAVAYDDAGKVAGQLGRTRTLRTRGADYERLLREGFVYFIDLPLKKPGGYQLRAALRDSATGRVGSAGQFVEVPDLKDGRLALSGLIVNGEGASGAASMSSSEEGRAAETGPAVRRFRRGALLDYGFYVYGARLGPSTQRPSLTTELRLFRDGRPVFTGKPLPFDAAGQTDLQRLVAGGSFRLGTDLAPGDYVLQVVVTDLLAEAQRRTSTSWIDFEIVE